MAKSALRPITGRIELHTWRDFTKVMKIMKAGKWIFRGQEDADWSLESGLDRYLKKFDKASSRSDEGSRDNLFLSTFPHAEYFAISRFRAMSRDRQDWGSNIEALVAMQHYGAKTRLLDFTTSIMVALFFAYETQTTGKNRAIYAINYRSLLEQDGVLNGYKKFLKEKNAWIGRGDELFEEDLEFQIENHYFQQFAFEEAEKIISNKTQDGAINVIPLYTVGSNKRQMAQTGVELMPRTFDWFDKNLAVALNVPVNEVNNPTCLVSDKISKLSNAESYLPSALVKIIFDSSMEDDAWQFLDQANINAATIYPDLTGIAKSIRYNTGKTMIDNALGNAKDSLPASSLWIPRERLFACSLSDAISSVMDEMAKNRYSHIPVLDERGKVLGVFSESTLIEVRKVKSGRMDSATMGDIASSLKIDNHKADVFRFVPKNATAAYLRKLNYEALQAGDRIGMFFVTENGSEDEPLLGILTVWDLARVSDTLSDTPKQN